MMNTMGAAVNALHIGGRELRRYRVTSAGAGASGMSLSCHGIRR
jgi:malic enzyme